MSPGEREKAVIRRLTSAICACGTRHVQQFAFEDKRGSRTSHYLIHATKNATASRIMKDIMSKASSWKEGGVASFRHGKSRGNDLFADCHSPIDELETELSVDFAGRTVSFERILSEHSTRSHYAESHYRNALLQMEAGGRVVVTCPTGPKRRVGTLPERCIVHFAGRRD